LLLPEVKERSQTVTKEELMEMEWVYPLLEKEEIDDGYLVYRDNVGHTSSMMYKMPVYAFIAKGFKDGLSVRGIRESLRDIFEDETYISDAYISMMISERYSLSSVSQKLRELALENGICFIGRKKYSNRRN
jgi:hypothetical protein